MDSIICTLFEGHYHYGVAALINSLYHQGYRGPIYVGYRGEMPSWSVASVENTSLSWKGSRTLQLNEGLTVHFLPIDTHYHFTNYKPDFMLRLWDTLANEAKSAFYFDPDIVITTPWSVYEEWVKHGVALCEDIHSPKAKHHPVRKAWRHYFAEKGFKLEFKEAIYANGGFIGVAAKDRSFLTSWQQLQEAMAPAIGGLGQSFLVTLPNSLPFAPFSIPDQDALNATVEAWDGAVSFVDKAGMGFISSSSLMSHAIGKGKPWARNPLKHMFAGEPPRRSDRDYWKSTNGPIVAHSTWLVRRRKLAIQIAALVGRFYSRN